MNPGTQLGPYEILSPLGAGGMGEVYRARDTKLDREVAIKVLPDVFAHDPERLARFKREAKVLASLNHPNIAAIYGFETETGEAPSMGDRPRGLQAAARGERVSPALHFLVLELVEGETLADRLRVGSLPVDETLDVGKQMAEALEAAHEHGVIHRDLKPSNIKVTPDGVVKVLDFGLAKAFAGDTSATGIAESPTITVEHTRPGVVLGTAAYMSPEQARGKPLDKRTDIWSFGCVLYECLTGTRPFGGETTSDVVAKILERDPDWDALPANTPPSVQLLLRRCLQKDRKRRLHDIGDARLELDDTLSGSMQAWAGAVLTAEGRRKGLIALAPWIIAAMLAVAVVALGVAYSRGTSTPSQTVRAYLPVPKDKTFVFTGDLAGPVRISPDGRALAFVARDADGKRRLWVRPLSGDSARALPNTNGACNPFWCPDSRSIGFFAKGRLKRIDASGGPAITICNAPVGKGGTWNQEGIILFPPTFRAPIHRVWASGGTPSPVTRLDESKHTTHRWPHFLPDGKHFLYVAANHDLSRREHDAIHFASLDGREDHVVMRTAANATFASGFLLFLHDNTLMAQRFDAKRGQFTGRPVPVAENVQYDPTNWRGVFTVSKNGILAFQVGGAVPGSSLVSFDRSGKELGSIGQEALYFGPRLSPDGARLVVAVGDPGDIWVYELARGVRTRLTFDPFFEYAAVWSPDGSRIAFASRVRPDGKEIIYLRSSVGSAGNEMLLESEEEVFPMDWSPDGRFLLYWVGTSRLDVSVDWWGEGGFMILPLSGDRKPFAFLKRPFAGAGASFSPDGRWIAYTSNESGSQEVYVAPFDPPVPPLNKGGMGGVIGEDQQPKPGGKTRISTSGGREPMWRQDGKELFFLASDTKLMAAEVKSEGSQFLVAAVRALFTVNPVAQGFAYDVFEDGQRFVINTVGREETAPITLVVNWTAELDQ